MTRAPTPDLATACPLGPDGQEDRGTPLWVWVSRYSDTIRFEPFPGAFKRVEVSVPVGWVLVADLDWGVLLVSTFGQNWTARAVLTAAERGECGFSVRGREAV